MVRYNFFFPDLKIKDLHPDALFKQETSLAKKFVLALPRNDKLDICPVSGNQRHEVLFEKWGVRYVLCPQTWSLCLGSMPDQKTIDHYFFDSELAHFRCTDQYQSTFANLRASLWASQVEWIEGRINRYLGLSYCKVVDWGPRMLGWVEIISKAPFINQYIIQEPLPPVSSLNHLDVVRKADVILLLDVIQREKDPALILKNIDTILKPGGIILLTCRSGSGFDILTLAGESESVFPLDHLCLPSPSGIKMLIEQMGYDLMELATPGLLDVQLVKKAGLKIPVEQRFQRFLIKQGEEVEERFQGFLQQSNLSSHLRVVARKPE